MFDCCKSALKVQEKVGGLGEWISLKDQEPPKGQPVLITDGKVIVASFWQVRREGRISAYRGPIPAPTDDSHGALIFSIPIIEYVWEGYGFGGPAWEWAFKGYEITHWMPLPTLPGKEVITNDRQGKGRIKA